MSKALVACITDLRSARAVIKALKKSQYGPHNKFIVTKAVWDKIYEEATLNRSLHDMGGMILEEVRVRYVTEDSNQAYQAMIGRLFWDIEIGPEGQDLIRKA